MWHQRATADRWPLGELSTPTRRQKYARAAAGIALERDFGRRIQSS
jgi:hypothetical protein